jgi:hypothetical protein
MFAPEVYENDPLLDILSFNFNCLKVNEWRTKIKRLIFFA